MKDHVIQKVVVQAKVTPDEVFKHLKTAEDQVKSEPTGEAQSSASSGPVTSGTGENQFSTTSTKSEHSETGGVSPSLPSGSTEAQNQAKPPKSPSILYRAGELVSKNAFDPDRLPAGCVYQNGRITRKRKSDRPENIPPEFWAKATPKLRAQWVEEALAKAATPAPAMPVVQRPPKHRQKVASPHAEFGLTMVARSVN